MLYNHDTAVKLKDDIVGFVDNVIVNKFVEQTISVLLLPVDDKAFTAINVNVAVMADNIVHDCNTKNVCGRSPIN